MYMAMATAIRAKMTTAKKTTAIVEHLDMGFLLTRPGCGVLGVSTGSPTSLISMAW